MPITDILSVVSKAGGLARPNRFDVEIVPPKIFAQASNTLSPQQTTAIQQQASVNGTTTQAAGVMTNYFASLGVSGQNAQSRLNFMCKATELPGRSFSTSDIRTYGSYFKMPHVDTYSDITLNFIVGEDMFEKLFFDAWFYTVQDPETADFNYVDEFATVIDVYQLNYQDEGTYGVRLFQCWPLSMGQLTLSYDEMNTYHVLPITFTYRKWINLLINTGTPTSIVPNGQSIPFEQTIYNSTK